MTQRYDCMNEWHGGEAIKALEMTIYENEHVCTNKQVLI